MAKAKRFSAAMLLVLSCLMTGCAKKAPVADMPPADFRLPKGFEQKITAQRGEEILVPEGHTILLNIKGVFAKNTAFMQDLRPLESALTVAEVPAGTEVRFLPEYSNIRKVDRRVESSGVMRIDVINLSAGASFDLSGKQMLRERFSKDNVLEEKPYNFTIKIVPYEATLEMIKDDRAAALFYVENSLRQYDKLTKNGHEVPWEPAEIEKKLAELDAMEATGLKKLLISRLRAEEARRHLSVAAQNGSGEVASAAKDALKDVDTAFEQWKNKGLDKEKKAEKVDQLFAEDKLDRRYAPLVLPKEEGFNANIDLPTIARPWLTPISMGLELESRFGAVGNANRRSTAIVETLSGQLAIHPRFWVALRLPVAFIRSQASGSKWTTELLNPGVTLGTAFVNREHWRIRLEVEYLPTFSVDEDLQRLELVLTEMPGSATKAHTIGINPSVELAASQFTLAVLTGVQLAINTGNNKTSALDAWFRYAIVGGVWLHKRFALQLDGRGRVLLNGDNHTSYGSFGFSGLINIHDYWNLELGLTTPLGDDSTLSSMQFYITIGCGKWGALTGKKKKD